MARLGLAWLGADCDDAGSQPPRPAPAHDDDDDNCAYDLRLNCCFYGSFGFNGNVFKTISRMPLQNKLRQRKRCICMNVYKNTLHTLRRQTIGKSIIIVIIYTLAASVASEAVDADGVGTVA